MDALSTDTLIGAAYFVILYTVEISREQKAFVNYYRTLLIIRRGVQSRSLRVRLHPLPN